MIIFNQLSNDNHDGNNINNHVMTVITEWLHDSNHYFKLDTISQLCFRRETVFSNNYELLLPVAIYDFIKSNHFLLSVIWIINLSAM